MTSLTFEWPGRGLAVDLAGTVVVLSPGREIDLLTSPSDLAHWLRVEEPWLGPAAEEAALRLPDFRGLRGAIRDLFGAVVAGEPIPDGPVDDVNAASAAVPTYPVLDVRDPSRPSVATVAGATKGRTAALLAAIARSAVEIVGGPDRDRLRVCPAPRCGRFFVSSRPGRRWCTDACGNRARVARHLQRRRATG